MALETGTIRKLAEQLEDAELQAYDVTMITADYPDLDWDDAYAIQDEIRRRKEARGSKITGLKAGLTSFAKMKQMGVETPVFGFVADYMGKPDGGEIKTSELIHPKVEAEICIVTKSDLEGPGCTVAAVMAATDFVLPAVEVIDSRYRDFKFDLKSVIADNTSSSRFVVGGRARERRRARPANSGRRAGEERGNRRDGHGSRRARQPAGGRGHDGQPPHRSRAADPGRDLHHDRRRHRGDPRPGRRPHRRPLP